MDGVNFKNGYDNNYCCICDFYTSRLYWLSILNKFCKGFSKQIIKLYNVQHHNYSQHTYHNCEKCAKHNKNYLEYNRDKCIRQ